MTEEYYIIPKEELDFIKKMHAEATIDIDTRYILQVTKRRKNYKVKSIYSGPDQTALSALCQYDGNSFLMIEKLLATIDSLNAILDTKSEENKDAVRPVPEEG